MISISGDKKGNPAGDVHFTGISFRHNKIVWDSHYGTPNGFGNSGPRFCLNTASSIGTFPDSAPDPSYFDLSRITLPPLGTYVIVGFEAADVYQMKADKIVYDTNEPGDYILHFYNDDALGLFRNDTLIDLIGKESVREVWDVAGVESVTSHSVNGDTGMHFRPSGKGIISSSCHTSMPGHPIRIISVMTVCAGKRFRFSDLSHYMILKMILQNSPTFLL